jgi:hypothetical protein
LSIDVDAHGPSVLDRDDVDVGELNVDTGMPRPPTEANRDNQVVSGVEELLRLDPHPLEVPASGPP